VLVSGLPPGYDQEAVGERHREARRGGSMGALGQAMIFVCLLAAEAVVGACVLGYAAHCFLVVVECTGGGNDEVSWPDEPMLDWIVQAVHLLWLVAFWLVPLGIAQRSMKDVFLPEAPLLLRFLLLAVPLLWLLFPISLLSSLSAGARWVFFNPKLLPRLGRSFRSLLLLYLLSGLLLGSCAAVWYFALSRVGVLVLLAAPAGAATLLIYARLLGWYAWRLGQVRPAKRKRPPPPLGRRARKQVKAVDPWAAPEAKPRAKTKDAEPPPKPLPVEGYGLAAETAAPRPDALTGEPVPATERKRKRVPKTEGPPRAARSDLPLPTPQPQTGPPPSLASSFTFPWSASGLKAWVWLTFGALLMGGMMALQVQFWPS
jgi:hypothetical protein